VQQLCHALFLVTTKYRIVRNIQSVQNSSFGGGRRQFARASLLLFLAFVAGFIKVLCCPRVLECAFVCLSVCLFVCLSARRFLLLVRLLPQRFRFLSFAIPPLPPPLTAPPTFHVAFCYSLFRICFALRLFAWQIPRDP